MTNKKVILRCQKFLKVLALEYWSVDIEAFRVSRYGLRVKIL
jgi:hypothetical protein